MRKLKEKSIPTALYYPVPIHTTAPYFSSEYLEITEKCAKSVISLPMHAYIEEDEIKSIKSTIKEALIR